MEQSSSEEETEEVQSSTTRMKKSSLLKQRQLRVAKPTLQLPSGFRWDDVGVVKGEGGTTSSESEEEAEQDDQEVRIQKKLKKIEIFS